MPVERCTIEICASDGWRAAAEVILRGPVQAGHRSPTRFEYELDYVSDHELGVRDLRAASVVLPLSFEAYDAPHWPAFLLDLVPQGAWRAEICRELGLPAADPRSDWQVLLHGGGNPPGNLRVAGATNCAVTSCEHEGFPIKDILERRQDFIEYARSHGAPVAGSSGAQGESPKFLLRLDDNDRWHADGVLGDARTKACYVVKFPRGSRDEDRDILRAEGAYAQLARWFGLRVHQPLRWESDCLFVPRFDRVRRGRDWLYLGQESLCAATGLAEFGGRVSQDRLLETVRRYSSAPDADALEFLCRDLLNVALGNTDNHARNSALLKRVDGSIRLSPLYDFAPMFLDPAGISRVCRWDASPGPRPDWQTLAVSLEDRGLVPGACQALEEALPRLAELPRLLEELGVPEPVRRACLPNIRQILRQTGGRR